MKTGHVMWIPAAVRVLSVSSAAVLMLGGLSACASVPMPTERLALAEAAVQRAITVSTEQELAAAQQSNAAQAGQLQTAAEGALDDQARLARRDAQVAELQAQMRLLDARKTERGMVVTLADVLFGTGQSRLRVLETAPWSSWPTSCGAAHSAMRPSKVCRQRRL